MNFRDPWGGGVSPHLSKGSEVLPDAFLSGFRVQTANKDLLDGLLLHGQRPLGVDLAPVQFVLALLQHLQSARGHTNTQ